MFTTSAAARHPRLLAVDAAVAAAAFAATIAVLESGRFGSGDARSLDALGVGLAAAAALPLAAWRRSPLGVFALTTLASTALAAAGYPPGPPAGPTLVLFLLAASGDEARPWTWRTTAIVATLYAGHVTAVGVGRDEFPTVPLAVGSLVWAVAWFAGDRTRLRRERIADLEQRVERERHFATVEERARIARDLHDSAGHAINVILVQAGAARLLLDEEPNRSREALTTIEDVARQTIGEIDRLVHTLRDDEAPGGQVADAPGLATLGALVERHRAAGLAVTVESRGTSRPLRATADQAAYRIVQESLTNASRHGTGSAHVELVFDDGALDVTITNPVTGATRGGAEHGHGLTGMRERAALAGGSLDAGLSGGAFRVRAVLPTREPAP